MTRPHFAAPTCALVLMVGCTIPDASKEISTFGAATGNLAGAVSDHLNAEVAAESKARRQAAVAAGAKIYSLTPGCTALLSETSSDGVLRQTADVTQCTVINRLDEGREPTPAELAKTLAGLISDYGVALEDLSKSDLPGEIETSTANLLTSVSNLAAEAKVDATGLKTVAPAISATVGFVSRRVKARILKQAIRQADDPIDGAVASLIAILAKQGRDPLYPAIERMQQAEKEMDDARTMPIAYASRVKGFEAAQVAYKKAYMASPSVALFQIRKTHASLVKRLDVPATLDELQSLIDELKTLKDIIEN